MLQTSLKLKFSAESIQPFLEGIVDQDIFMRNGSPDTAKEGFLRNGKGNACLLGDLSGKILILPGKA